ncbi:extracellular solute-binding protein [Pseudorhodoferax sp.]|uniref:extracellular solute-binding protein n=1 Tax=Pseudorhodoferax sp. TaxID=1993553 RepID=UPI002DD6AF13|nr:extracellular solute-binding protein [Pseudorhodoferax sp.]
MHKPPLYKALFGALTASMALCSAVAQAQSTPAVKEIRILEAGGPSGDSVEQAYIKPFTARTGIKVTRESPASAGKLQAMVQSKNITATLVELGATDTAAMRALGMLEPLDWAAINPDPIYPEARQPDAFGWQYSSTLMAWAKGTKPPKTWADFWNVKDFPGKRAMPDYPAASLAIALLADGVPPDQLFPLDIDRAFASLQKIKGSVAVWWKAGAQPPQLLEDKEVSYSVAWSGRVIGNPKIDYTYNQGLLSLTTFVVPKGADPAAKAAAMGLLHEASKLQNQLVAANIIPYTGASPGIEKLVPKERINDFPTSEANKKVQVQTDATWTAANAALLQKRWQEFKLGL